ncbi:MAG: ATP-binding protein [Pirellulaceae bacterium]|nr:ATP-binding protein [Pirellulaceae bacterium]
MAQDVNQSEMDVASQVRSALVARISQERYELWMPEDSLWQWADGVLTIACSNDFSRQIAKRMLHDELKETLVSLVGNSAGLVWSVMEESAEDLISTRVNEADAGAGHAGAGHAGAGHAGSELLCATATATTTTTTTSVNLMTAGSLSRSALPATVTSACAPLAPESTSQDPLILSGNFAGQSKRANKDHRDGPAADEPSARQQIDYWSEFIPGSSNQMAWNAINMIVSDPGSMTPALLHGPFGVGKSHLATALAQRLRMHRRQRRVLHITSEQFTNDFTEAIRGSGLPIMRRKYRDVDTLILDDLQFLLGKKATIGELRHTLDNLLKSGRQIVFLADRSLGDLEGLGAEFIGRLRGGLVTPLLPLDEVTRFEMLKRDLRLCEVALSDNIILQIAARAIGDGRLLKGIVKRLMATSYINEHPLTWDECWNAIYDLIQATQPIVRLGDIERVVCEVFGLEPLSLQSDRKTRQVSQPRMLAMFLARKYTPAAYQEIGEYFGNRRHSTVISAEKTVGGWLEENAKLQLPRGTLGIRDAMRHVEANLHVG